MKVNHMSNIVNLLSCLDVPMKYSFTASLRLLSKQYIKLTHCRLDGLLIKYPQFPDVLNALNVQPHNIFLLTV